MNAVTRDRLREARAEKKLVALVTDLACGAQALVIDGRVSTGELSLSDDAVEAADRAARSDKSQLVEQDGRRLFIRAFSPPRRLFVVGAVHVAQVLVDMARQLNFAVTLIDPRDAWATEQRFPGVAIDRRWPDEALAAGEPDRRTAIVTLSHDPKLDQPALGVALRSDAFYIGALGSRRTHARRLESLREEGFRDDELARIHGPIGLDIGAISPAEIAIAILAEITQALRPPN